MILTLSLLACGPGHQDQAGTPAAGGPAGELAAQAGSAMIQNKGSDTMVNLAQAWAEAYRAVRPATAIAVSGGGSGTGIAALENNTVDIANASRELHPEEREIKAAVGKDAIEHVVAYDAIAVYVHKDNPMVSITKAQLADIYGEKGTATKWSDLGITVPSCSNGAMILVSRQNNSGTFEFFREWTLGKGDFRMGTRDMQGSKDVVDAVRDTPCAIGYSGMGYKTPDVRWLPVSSDGVTAPVEPSVDAVHGKTYPLSRPLFMDTDGEAEGEVARYIQWVQSSPGQAVVEKAGFVPLPAAEVKPVPQ